MKMILFTSEPISVKFLGHHNGKMIFGNHSDHGIQIAIVVFVHCTATSHIVVCARHRLLFLLTVTAAVLTPVAGAEHYSAPL